MSTQPLPEDTLYVQLGSGVGLRVKITAIVPPVVDTFDERPSATRLPTYAEVIEGADLLSAGRGELWRNQQRLEGPEA